MQFDKRLSDDFDDQPYYFNSNSLGLTPKKIGNYLEEIEQAWISHHALGYFQGSDPWANYSESCIDSLSKLLGANREEICLMGSLSSNLHALLFSLYRPTKSRYKVIMLKGFSSDAHVLKTHIQQRLHSLFNFGVDHDLSLDKVLIEIPLDANMCVDMDAIEKTIITYGHQTALVWLEGVHFLSGELLDMEFLTKIAHDEGCLIGFDLAHAVANIPLRLHAWGVDCAVWCGYKYLCAGPGALAGIYLNEVYAHNQHLDRMGGWWGQEKGLDFFDSQFTPRKDAQGWQLSCPNLFALAAMRASLDSFNQLDLTLLYERNKYLSSYFCDAIMYYFGDKIKILNPSNHAAQITLQFPFNDAASLFRKNQVFCDERLGLTRFAFYGLYNTVSEIDELVNICGRILKQVKNV